MLDHHDFSTMKFASKKKKQRKQLFDVDEKMHSMVIRRKQGHRDGENEKYKALLKTSKITLKSINEHVRQEKEKNVQNFYFHDFDGLNFGHFYFLCSCCCCCIRLVRAQYFYHD